ncbi:hypothetical protein [Paenibacillus sp. yr247]|uniref:hypothetical protein n=1 Tax=Paenibacillus sp. yr247 TaxID=1761880 RepID=UPI000B845862|nr:hypothetical protein [Paenibacillus sp. yr247]
MSSSHENVIYSPDDQAKMAEMKELIIDAFDETSSLYEIYKKRGWLVRIFTDRILLMDKDATYSTQQAADIIEVPEYNVRNKRKDFMEYLNPLVLESGSKVTYKFNYISVFKMKMIDGLTGEGGDYTLPQLKQLLYNHNRFTPAEKTAVPPGDQFFEALAKIEVIIKDEIEAVRSELYGFVNRKIESLALPDIKALQDANDASERLYKKLKTISDEIISTATSIEEKESFLAKLAELKVDYPEQLPIIDLYQKSLTDSIRLAKEEVKSRDIQQTRSKVLDLFHTAIDGNKSLEERERAQNLIREVISSKPEYREFETLFTQAMISIRDVRQEKREEEIRGIKNRALELYELATDPAKSKGERDNFLKQLQDLSEKNPELSFDVRHYIAAAQLTNKKRSKFLGIF